MTLFAGLDVSVRGTSVCVVDAAGKVLAERKIATEPDDLIELLRSISSEYGRIGLEAGPLSQWLVNGLAEAGLPIVCVETRHMKALLTAQQINKSDRNDARGIAQMMRIGLFKPVHVKTLAAQEQRMLLTSRKLLQRKAAGRRGGFAWDAAELRSEGLGGERRRLRSAHQGSGGVLSPPGRHNGADVTRAQDAARTVRCPAPDAELRLVRHDPVCRRLMRKRPGVGLVWRSPTEAAVDQPQRFLHSKRGGGERRSDTQAIPVWRERL